VLKLFLFRHLGQAGRLSYRSDTANREAPMARHPLTLGTACLAAFFSWHGRAPAGALPVPNPYARASAVNTSPKRQAIYDKLRRITLDTLYFDNLPLSEVVKTLAEESRKRDPEGKGLNFLLSSTADPRPEAGPQVDPVTGGAVPAAGPAELGGITVRVTPTLRNVTLEEALDIVVKCAAEPIKYSVEDYAILFTGQARTNPPLYTRTFKIDANTFHMGLAGVRIYSFGNVGAGGYEGYGGYGGGGYGGYGGGAYGGGYGGYGGHGGYGGYGGARNESGTGGSATNTVLVQAHDPFMTRPDFFASVGVSMEGAKSAAWNPRLGELEVKATRQDLDAIEKGLQLLRESYFSLRQQAILAKLREIKFDNFSSDRLPLGEVVNKLAAEARKRDPARAGLNFLSSNQTGRPRIPAPAPETSGGPLGYTNPNEIGAVEINVAPARRQVSLQQALDLIVAGASAPIRYSIEDYGVIFWHHPEAPAAAFRAALLSGKKEAQLEKDRQIWARMSVLQSGNQRGETNSIQAPPPEARHHAIQTGPGIQATRDKLRRIKLATLFCDQLPLPELAKHLEEQAAARDPEGKGLRFRLSEEGGPKIAPSPQEEQGWAFPAGSFPDLKTVPISITPTVRNVTLEDALEIIVRVTLYPFTYSVEEDGVLFVPQRRALLCVGTYQIDAKSVRLGRPGEPVSQALQDLFCRAGFGCWTPEAFSYDEGRGLATFRAMREDLDAVEEVIRIAQPPKSQ
jgi:hypothetical protein